MPENEVQAVIINKKNLAKPNDSIVFVSPDDFGWRFREYRLPFQKLNYLWTAILGGAGDQVEWQEYLRDALLLPTSTQFKTDTKEVDPEMLEKHAEFLGDLVKKFKGDSELLRKFIYGDSYIISTALSGKYPDTPGEFENDEVYVYGQWEV